MNDMRKLINLMEGVMAVPRLNEAKFQNVSCSQCGKGFGPGDSGYSHCSDHKGRTPVDEACAMNENYEYDLNFIAQAIRSNYGMATSEDELKRMVAGETGYGQHPKFDNMFHSALDHFLNGDDSMIDDYDDSMDGDFDSAMASAGYGSDEDYGGDDFPMEDANDINSSLHPINIIRSIISQLHPNDTSMDAIAREIPPLARDPQFSKWYKQACNSYYGVSDNSGHDEDDFTDYTMRQGEMGNPDRAMEENLNNGYRDIEVANGRDFFPNGADSPVVSATGPSGARQGDNPEQKKMQVAETHKELVYAYRNFLKESVTKKKS